MILRGSSFKDDDVKLLLKDIKNELKEEDNKSREIKIQNGVHYSSMLPIEYKPSKLYEELFEDALKREKHRIALMTETLCKQIYKEKGENVVIVSLARAGIPAGVLVKRYFKDVLSKEIEHYAISIIRDIGIDENAIKYILDRHASEDIVFLDGWTGKGTILRELKKEVLRLNEKYDVNLSYDLAVLTDPAKLAKYRGALEDILIPSSCLNSTVSGLISRTVYNTDIISEKDFHGIKIYNELVEDDKTYKFIDSVVDCFSDENEVSFFENGSLLKDIDYIVRKHDVKDINFIKPGIGETTRVLLRRVPWKVVIDHSSKDDDQLAHIIKLATEKNVEIELDELTDYKCIGIIKNMKDV